MEEMRDYLTGLYNRQGMYGMWDVISTKNKTVQLLFIDIDNFKTVNDLYGHKAGDKVLIGIGEMLKELSPDDGISIRLGGDEFVVIIPGEKDEMSLVSFASGVLARINEVGASDRCFEIISASIGIVNNADVTKGLDMLLSYSDSAMYYAKYEGKNRFVFFHNYEKKIIEEREMEKTAESALRDGLFSVRYYTVRHLQDSHLVCTIATPVWSTLNGEYRTRDRYKNVLEKSGIIKEVDFYNFRAACDDYSRMNSACERQITMGVVISKLLLDEDIAVRLKRITDEKGLDAESFIIFIEEGMFAVRSVGQLLKNIDCLHEAGFRLGIEGFGKDFSSIRYLDGLPVSMLLFDGEYIKENVSGDEGRGILKSMFHMAKTMHVMCIAQQVEDREQVDKLIEEGCDGASGEYFSGLLDIDTYIDHLSGIKESDKEYIYDFMDNLETGDGGYAGEMIGEGVRYVEGISRYHGGLRFEGGPVETNIVKLPAEVFSGGSFTVTMWLRPMEIQNWISALYIRMRNGFASFMPRISGNISMFRIHPDGINAVWTDAMTAALPLGRWTHIAIVYDIYSRTGRVYINGEFAAMHGDIVDNGPAVDVCLGGDSYQDSYRGDISALCIYEGPRTDDEIKRQYLSYLDEPGFVGDETVETTEEYIVHDPAIYEDESTGMYYLYCTHNLGWVSDDMEHWKSLDRIIEGVPDEAKAWTNSEDIWAPDIVKVKDRYRLYCSNSSWGVQQSCIFIAESDKPEGPFIPGKVVLKTDDTMTVNGIDANIITDHKTGEMYMVYGSFWGGIHLLPLDSETGLARDAGEDGRGVGSLRLMDDYRDGMTIGDLSEEERIRRQGICIARRPLWNDGAIEGPYIIYLEETGYYYLFVSYGSLRSDYNIRIGRSRTVTGPYLDFNGRSMTDIDDKDCSVGLMISAGYHWLNETTYMAPGHNSVLKMSEGELFLVSHIRKLQYIDDNPGEGLLQTRRLHVTPDGWLIAGALPYAKETFRIARDPLIPGKYERIELRPSIPQGIMHAHPLILHEDGKLECCSVMGRWKKMDDYSLEFEYGGIREFVHVEKGTDREWDRTTVMLSGLTSDGICTWGKKV